MPDNEENEKLRAKQWLMSELEKGERSAREEGWISSSEVKKILLDNTAEQPEQKG